MADVGAVHTGARQRFAHDLGGQFGGGMSFRLPPKVPMAVRTPLTTTTSRLMER
jgi:hypothetical protein